MGTMRTRAAATVCLAIAVLVSGCTTPEPERTPTPTASPSPVFASDEEALAAAEQAYADYLAMSDLIAQEGGADPGRMSSVATGSALDTATADLSEYVTENVRSVGSTTFTIEKSERLQLTAPVSISIFVCDDVSNVDVLDVEGDSLVSPERPDRSPFRVEFEELGGLLIVTSREFWEGGDYC